MARVIGIDLGTTNSAAAILTGATPEIIPTQEGTRLVPSVVAIDKNENTLVGTVAKNQAVTNPENTVFSVKRFIGRNYSADEIQRDKKLVPYEIKAGTNDEVLIVLQGKTYRPEEISAKILQKIKSDAEAFLGQPVTEAVITVPAYFNDSQRQATKDAGRIAGLDVKRILNEPTAAALAYGLGNKKEGKIAVFDLGGGTFDITILDIGDGVFEVLSTNGNTHLGGDDFDQRIIEHLSNTFKAEMGIDLQKDKLALQRLRDAASKAKHELSTLTTTDINIPFITADASGPKHLDINLSRAKLEEITKDLINDTVEPCKKALDDAKVSINDISDVILVGGMTRMPAIIEKVKQIFGKEPSKSVNPDEAVALGAAIQAGILQGDVKDILLLDVTPLTLGIETLGGVATSIIPRNTTIPVSKSQVFSTAADNQTSVEVHIVQGEREMAADNKTLGRFVLEGIPPSPRGIPQVEVTFDIDANGILNVSAKDKATGKSQKVTIQASSGLTSEEIDKMQKDAAENAETDKQKRRLAEKVNEAENLVYSARKAVEENKDKIAEQAKAELEADITELESIGSHKNAKVEDYDKINDLISKISKKMGESVYGQGGQSSETAQAGPEDTASAQEPTADSENQEPDADTDENPESKK